MGTQLQLVRSSNVLISPTLASQRHRGLETGLLAPQEGPSHHLPSRPREGPSGAHREALSFQGSLQLICSLRTGHRPFLLDALTVALLLPLSLGLYLPTDHRGETKAVPLTPRAPLCPPAYPVLLWLPHRAWLGTGASQGLALSADTLAPNGTWHQNLTSVGKSSN